MRRGFQILLSICLAAVVLHAQQPPGFGGRGGPPGSGRRGPSPGRPGDPAEGKWWFNPAMVRRLGLSREQQGKIEQIFQQNRVKLIDLSAALEKEQAILDPLLSADHPQESQVLAQFDRVADARRELEKANARMLWGFRSVLTADQWKTLQSTQDGGAPGPPDRGGPIR
jgi:Spy/CpxP family protein refolding chaperone